MSKTPNTNTTRAARRMLYWVVGAAMLCVPALAVADETFSLQQVVVIPGAPLVSFDISFVDPGLNQYFLADRSNSSIDIIDVNSFHVRQIIPPAPNNFVGNTGVSTTSGPNGVLTLSARGPDDFWTDDVDGRHFTPQIWAGDGNSTVKIIDYKSGNVLNVVNTGGSQRADELCFDPKDDVVMIANDGDPDLFVTFISTTGNNAILGKIKFDGTDANGMFLHSTGGIEQCQWNSRDGFIYLNIPSTTLHSQGDTVRIDPVAMKVVADFAAGSVADNCQPAGMALGPQALFSPGMSLLLGCGPNTNNVSLVMNASNGSTVEIPGNSGADEVWYNPNDGHYFLGEGNNPTGHQLGIVDSLSNQPDQNVIGTGVSSHSVAADPQHNNVFVPIRGTGGGSTFCGSTAPAQAQGCVAIFSANGPPQSNFIVRNTGPASGQSAPAESQSASVSVTNIASPQGALMGQPDDQSASFSIPAVQAPSMGPAGDTQPVVGVVVAPNSGDCDTTNDTTCQQQ